MLPNNLNWNVKFTYTEKKILMVVHAIGTFHPEFCGIMSALPVGGWMNIKGFSLVFDTVAGLGNRGLDPDDLVPHCRGGLPLVLPK